MALSTFSFRGIVLPPLTPSSAVIMYLESQSSKRPARASGENHPNTTEWTAPILAHDNIAMAASGIIGI